MGARLGYALCPLFERRDTHQRGRRRPSRLHRHVGVDRPRAGRARDPAHQPRAPEPRQRANPGRAPARARRGLGGARRVRVHLIAACGVGMSALAALLRAAGHTVTGSDEHVYPPASTVLEQLGVAVLPGWDPGRLAGADLVVCGNAVRRTNPEAVAAAASGVRVVSFPQALAELFLAGRRPMVVAGTHGKTTSAAMLAWVLARCGRDPGYLIGGLPCDLPSSADIYRDLDHVKGAFRRLVALLPADAPLAVCGDFPHALEVVDPGRTRVQRFGLGAENPWRVTDLVDDGRTRFVVREGDRAVCQ